jgi:hypothetical protein
MGDRGGRRRMRDENEKAEKKGNASEMLAWHNRNVNITVNNADGTSSKNRRHHHELPRVESD